MIQLAKLNISMIFTSLIWILINGQRYMFLVTKDLFLLNFNKMENSNLIELVPKPRSGFVMGVSDNLLFMYGGYSKEKKRMYGEAKGVIHTGIILVYILKH